MSKKNTYEVAIDKIEKELMHLEYNKGYVSGLISIVTEHVAGLCYTAHKFKCTSIGDYSDAEAKRISAMLMSVLMKHPDYIVLKGLYG